MTLRRRQWLLRVDRRLRKRLTGRPRPVSVDVDAAVRKVSEEDKLVEVTESWLESTGMVCK